MELNSHAMTRIFLAFFLLFSALSNAQKLPNKWYFGYQAGLNFTKGSPFVVRGQTGQTTQKGIQNRWMRVENEPFLVMGDEEGNVLFYSDGTKVWNDKYYECDTFLTARGTHAQIMAVKLPESVDRYLIITPDGGNGRVQSWVFSEIKVGEKIHFKKFNQEFIVGDFMEAGTVVPHCNGIDYWIVLRRRGKSKEYLSFLVNKKGIQKPIVSQGEFETVEGTNPEFSPQIGVMAVNNAYNVIATTFHKQDKDKGGVELMEFDNRTGRLTKQFAFIDNFSDPTDVYGVCFSPNDSLLYVTECEGEKVNQFRIYYNKESKINASRMVLHHGSQTNARFGHIQMGPDSCLYIPSDFNGRAYELGCNFIGVIKRPNEIGGKAKWQPEEICITVDYKMHTGLGLPSLNKFHKKCPQEQIVEVEEEEIAVVEEKPEIKVEKGDTIILPNLVFESNSDELTDAAKEVVDEIYLILYKNKNISIRIEGHTDDIGDFRTNLILSHNRALAVKNYLIERGVSALRLKSKGFGEALPKVPNTNKELRASNRRVEFIIK